MEEEGRERGNASDHGTMATCVSLISATAASFSAFRCRIVTEENFWWGKLENWKIGVRSIAFFVHIKNLLTTQTVCIIFLPYSLCPSALAIQPEWPYLHRVRAPTTAVKAPSPQAHTAFNEPRMSILFKKLRRIPP